MVSFLSLFLGLVLGHQTVAVQVAEPVARVEILLDGRQVAEMAGSPWNQQIDLGSDLIPHELTAVAFDERDVELDRAVQWLNLPRQPAESTILIEAGAEGKRRTARVSWESLTGNEPSAVRAVFDGLPLEIDNPRVISLPDHDPSVLHFLRVEMEFDGLVGASAEITFGGVYTDRVNTELTSLAIELDGRKKLPPTTEMQGSFWAKGRPLRVVAVEKGQAELLIVRDQDAWTQLRRIRRLVISRQDSTGLPHSFHRARVPNGSRGQRWFYPVEQAWDAWTLQFLWPVARRLDRGEGPYDLFSNSQKYAGSAGSLHGWLTTVEQPAEIRGAQRLSDAVAIAGLTAASANRRRGVLLVLRDTSEEASDAKLSAIRTYLKSLGVPLFVWTVAPGADHESRWGEVVDVSSPERMSRATLEIFHRLERQRIIWLEGIYLPNKISLVSLSQGFRTISGL